MRVEGREGHADEILENFRSLSPSKESWDPTLNHLQYIANNNGLQELCVCVC